jgi:hypothetical protein
LSADLSMPVMMGSCGAKTSNVSTRTRHGAPTRRSAGGPRCSPAVRIRVHLSAMFSPSEAVVTT